MASAPPLDDPEDPSIIRSPDIPYVCAIPGGAHAGRAIVIKGLVLTRHQNDHRRFNIDLCCGLLVQGDHTDNKAMHFNPRFDSGGSWFSGAPDHQVVLNTLVNNEWGKEDRYENPFEEGKPFSMRILMLEKYFKIEVNGKHLCDYPHRVPLTSVKTVYIAGCVSIDFLEFQPHMGGGGGSLNVRSLQDSLTEVSAPKQPSKEDFKIDKPTLPLMHQLVGFVHPATLKLTLTPFMSGHQFVVDFYSRKEVVFHFRVDFEDEKQKAAIVRNNTVKGTWQKEDRHLNEFPFHRGVTTDILFTAFDKNIAVDVDGFPLLKFDYRNGATAGSVDQVSIRGDISLMRFHLKYQ